MGKEEQMEYEAERGIATGTTAERVKGAKKVRAPKAKWDVRLGGGKHHNPFCWGRHYEAQHYPNTDFRGQRKMDRTEENSKETTGRHPKGAQ